MKNKIEFDVQIVNDNFDYSDEHKQKVNKFKSCHSGKRIQITMELIDGPRHHLFKYYFGTLLPSFAEAYGEVNLDYVDKFFLKKDFLFIRIDNDLKNIDRKHNKNNIFIVEDRVDMETGELKPYVVGYIPSKACLTNDEMKEFIKKVEHRLFVDMASHILPELQDGSENRVKGMDIFNGDDVNGNSFEDMFEEPKW